MVRGEGVPWPGTELSGGGFDEVWQEGHRVGKYLPAISACREHSPPCCEEVERKKQL